MENSPDGECPKRKMSWKSGNLLLFREFSDEYHDKGHFHLGCFSTWLFSLPPHPRHEKLVKLFEFMFLPINLLWYHLFYLRFGLAWVLERFKGIPGFAANFVDGSFRCFQSLC